MVEVASASETSRERSELKPRSVFRLKIDGRRGRRMSASIIKTFAPVWARLIAVLTAVVVLPSDGILDVTSNVRGGLPAVDNSIDVRKCRYASAIGECFSRPVRNTSWPELPFWPRPFFGADSINRFALALPSCG